MTRSVLPRTPPKSKFYAKLVKNVRSVGVYIVDDGKRGGRQRNHRRCVVLQNKLPETLVAPKNKYTIIKWSHSIAATSRYARGVTVNDRLHGRICSASDAHIQVGSDHDFVKTGECADHGNPGKDLTSQWINKQVIYSIPIVFLERSYCFCNQLGFGIRRADVTFVLLDK